MTDFEKLVMEMRNAQCEYFRHRGQKALATAKRLEKEVDEYLFTLKPKKPGFGNLFNLKNEF